jgi:hypothetical protein
LKIPELNHRIVALEQELLDVKFAHHKQLLDLADEAKEVSVSFHYPYAWFLIE